MESFKTQFSDRQPTEIISCSEMEFPIPLLGLIATSAGWSDSRSELRRVFEAGGVELNAEKQLDPTTLINEEDLPATLKVGKRILVRLVR